MEISYLRPITEEALLKRLSNEIEGKILSQERISSRVKKTPYQIKEELDEKYLEHVKGIISEVGEFIKNFLPFRKKGDFDYVRKHNVEFLNQFKVLEKIKVKTEKEEKKLFLSFDLLGSVYNPKITYRIKGKDVYLYNHLESRISFVIGNRESPKTDDEIINGALEELWHLAIYPHLLEKLNRDIKNRKIRPTGDEISQILVKEGEFLAKAFALSSLEEFAKKRQYSVSKPEVKGEVKNLAEKIKRIGIKKALKEISKPEFFDI